MKSSLLISLLLACTPLAVGLPSLPDLSAAEGQARQDFASYPEAVRAKEMAGELARQMQQIMLDWTQKGEAFVAPLPVLAPQPLPPEPEASNDTIVDSTEGLYFDSINSTMSYFGQVRMRDPRLHLDCERLDIQLEQRRVKQESIEMEKRVEQTAARDFAPSEHAQTDTVIAKERVPSPMVMTAKHVLVDMHSKRLLAKGDVVEMKHVRGEIRASGGQASILVADDEGLIYVQGEHIEGFSIDEAGEKSEFSTEGYALFELESDSLLLAKNNKVQTPRGNIASRGQLRIRLHADEQQKEEPDKGFRLNRSYVGLSFVTACEDVVVSGTQADGSPFHLAGDLLSYDARLGELMMTGDSCQLAFADQKMQVKGDAMTRLYADGSIKLKGADINGTYQRQSRTQEGQESMLHGSFRTQVEMFLVAADGKMYCPHGLVLKDDEIDFTCSREMIVEFERELNATEPKTEDAVAVMPDMAFTGIKGIAKVYAKGDIVAKGMGEFEGFAQGEEFEANLIEGTAHITSKPTQWAQFIYQGSHLKACSQGQAADLQLLSNGDMVILGEQIEAYLPAHDDQSSFAVETKEKLYLNNAESLLVMPHYVYMQSEQGIFSSQGGVTARLRREQTESKSQGGFARHDFRFVGLEWAESPRHSSIQTAQLSLQCDGLMRILLDETGAGTGQNAMLAGLTSAEAHDAVRFIAKDAQGALYRATGDHLNIDGLRGTKILTGSRVTLQSGKKTHEASGAGAQVFVDAKNNVILSGERQTSVMTDVVDELGRSPQAKENKKKKP